MVHVLIVFILIPIVGFIFSLVVSNNEKIIALVANITTGIQHIAALFFIANWWWIGHPPLNLKNFTLYEDSGYSFFLDFYFDSITAVYLLVGSLLSFMITIYSRAYMHREAGFKRFYSSILFFFLGYNLIIFSGNFEILFLGWEILGISSFLLIGFYRHRYLPVRNAFKVFSLYRLGDAAMLLAMWMSHHLWHHNITFIELNNTHLVIQETQSHFVYSLLISLMILLAAMIKSAQAPFSSWLPRAMEGPTPSSAIFYSSLSVHIGVFMLLRTYPFWSALVGMRLIIGLVGVSTSCIASVILRTQSTVKSQIAYSSIVQIGLIFLEVALGFHILALLHFTGNAFLRTYQLLISPSIVTLKIRELQFSKNKSISFDTWPTRLRNTLYVLSLREFNFDSFQFKRFWKPLKTAGGWVKRIPEWITFVFMAVCLTYLIKFQISGDSIYDSVWHNLAYLAACMSMVAALRAFVERKRIAMPIFWIVKAHVWLAITVGFNEQIQLIHYVIYFSGILFFGILAVAVAYYLKRKTEYLDLGNFYGLVQRYPLLNILFLVSVLGIMCFPISPSFLGEDLIISHIHPDQLGLALLSAMTFLLIGLASIRVYARIFLGPYASQGDPFPLKSS